MPRHVRITLLLFSFLISWLTISSYVRSLAPRLMFCPVPHTSRDQIWLAIGVGIGALVHVAISRSRRASSGRVPAVTDSHLGLNTDSKKITEYFGSSTTGESRISGARVQIVSPSTEGPHLKMFEEWLIVLEGELSVTWKGETFNCSRNQSIYLPQGEYIYEYKTPGEYIALCLPAWRPE